jgi:hypothetical protein
MTLIRVSVTRGVTYSHFNRQGLILEELHGKKDVGPTCGFAASPEVGLGVLSVPLRPSTPAYKLKIKTRG